MQNIVKQIAESDRKFAPVIANAPLCDLGRSKSNQSHFESLVSSVISQQLATAAARTINERFRERVRQVSPKQVYKLDEDALRGVGLSGAKTKTIKGLALAAINKEIDFEKLDQEDDLVVYEKLTKLWGIGPWTVDMFMMFKLGRLDIWPTGDLGVRRGWEKIHNAKIEITPNELLKKGDKFQPYRSVVAWYCWRALDN
jgi:DNA-3-methyladenine glycosylase II